MILSSAAREPYAADARRLGGDLAPGTTWIIDHVAERLSEVLNQPVPVPHPHRRKDDA